MPLIELKDYLTNRLARTAGGPLGYLNSLPEWFPRGSFLPGSATTSSSGLWQSSALLARIIVCASQPSSPGCRFRCDGEIGSFRLALIGMRNVRKHSRQTDPSVWKQTTNEPRSRSHVVPKQ